MKQHLKGSIFESHIFKEPRERATVSQKKLMTSEPKGLRSSANLLNSPDVLPPLKSDKSVPVLKALSSNRPVSGVNPSTTANKLAISQSTKDLKPKNIEGGSSRGAGVAAKVRPVSGIEHVGTKPRPPSHKS